MTSEPDARPSHRVGSSRRPRWDAGTGRVLLWATLLRGVMMLGQFLVVVWMRRPDQSASSRLQLWDARLYADIAAHGYGSPIVIGSDGNLVSGMQYAFFPLYPTLSWIASHLLQVSAMTGGIVVAMLCSLLLGPLVALVTRQHGGSRVAALLAVALLGLLPMSVVFEMGYAESLFAALSLGALACAQRARWTPAGVLLLLAGLTRPVGYVVALGVLVMGVQRWRAASGPAVTGRPRRELVPVVLASAMGCVGMPVMWIAAALRAHRATAWFDVQRAGWGTSFDHGAAFLEFARTQVLHSSEPQAVAAAVMLVVLGWLGVVVATSTRRLLPWAVMSALTWATVVLASNYWHSKPRLLLAAAPAVVPAAVWLARQPARVVVAVLLVAAGASWWFSAYMVTGWPYAI